MDLVNLQILLRFNPKADWTGNSHRRQEEMSLFHCFAQAFDLARYTPRGILRVPGKTTIAMLVSTLRGVIT